MKDADIERLVHADDAFVGEWFKRISKRVNEYAPGQTVVAYTCGVIVTVFLPLSSRRKNTVTKKGHLAVNWNDFTYSPQGRTL